MGKTIALRWFTFPQVSGAKDPPGRFYDCETLTDDPAVICENSVRPVGGGDLRKRGEVTPGLFYDCETRAGDPAVKSRFTYGTDFWA
jgi:hypothetical protein